MSMLQLGIGMTTLSMVGALVVNAVLPDAPPITVQSLSYADGMITTERTIEADGTIFYLRRTPEIIDVKSGDVVPNCAGSEGRNVTVGHLVASAPLAVWVANPLCTPETLPPGTYRPQIVYRWGDKQLPFVGTPFTIEAKP